MAPLLVALGGFALLAGVLLVASFGERLRIGRLLAGTPTVPIADLASLADEPRPPYVRVEGRIDSEDEFEDAAHRPLVFRRTLVQLGRRGMPRGGWRTVDEGREVVPFSVADAQGEAAIATDDLGSGLVVIPREATGVAGDAPDRVPAGTPVDTPLRFRIDQVSSIEHAVVLGVPVRTPAGVELRAGAGRPLVLTTLDQPEAMRILAGGRQPLLRVAVAAFVGGCVLVLVGLVVAVAGIG